MVGKTSLVKAVARRVDRPTIYVNLWGARGTQGLIDAFLAGLNASRPVRSRVARILQRVEGVSIGPAGITLASKAKSLRTLWDLVRTIGEESGRSVVILDEVQELAAISGPLLKALANLFNTRPEIVFVFTGSIFGLLRTLLEPSAGSPLFGRSPASLRLEPFPRETSVEFLSRGFTEYRLSVPRTTLEAVVDRSIDGIPGWLTLYGNSVAVQVMESDRAERATLIEGKKVARSEIAHFLEHRPTELYWPALRAMTSELTWTELRDTLSARRGGRVNDNTVGHVLRSLREANLIVDRDHHHIIGDPMVRAFVRETDRPPR